MHEGLAELLPSDRPTRARIDWEMGGQQQQQQQQQRGARLPATYQLGRARPDLPIGVPRNSEERLQLPHVVELSRSNSPSMSPGASRRDPQLTTQFSPSLRRQPAQSPTVAMGDRLPTPPRSPAQRCVTPVRLEPRPPLVDKGVAAGDVVRWDPASPVAAADRPGGSRSPLPQQREVQLEDLRRAGLVPALRSPSPTRQGRPGVAPLVLAEEGGPCIRHVVAEARHSVLETQVAQEQERARFADIRTARKEDGVTFWDDTIQRARQRDEELELRLQRVEAEARRAGRPAPALEYTMRPIGDYPHLALLDAQQPSLSTGSGLPGAAGSDRYTKGSQASPLPGSPHREPFDSPKGSIEELIRDTWQQHRGVEATGTRNQPAATEARAIHVQQLSDAPAGTGGVPGSPRGGVESIQARDPHVQQASHAPSGTDCVPGSPRSGVENIEGPPYWARKGRGVPEFVRVNLDGMDKAYGGIYKKVSDVRVGGCAVYGASRLGSELFLTWAEHGKWVIALTSSSELTGPQRYVHADPDQVVPLEYKESV